MWFVYLLSGLDLKLGRLCSVGTIKTNPKVYILTDNLYITERRSRFATSVIGTATPEVSNLHSEPYRAGASGFRVFTFFLPP